MPGSRSSPAPHILPDYVPERSPEPELLLPATLLLPRSKSPELQVACFRSTATLPPALQNRDAIVKTRGPRRPLQRSCGRVETAQPTLSPYPRTGTPDRET